VSLNDHTTRKKREEKESKMAIAPEEFKGQHVPVALSDGELPEKYKVKAVPIEESVEDSKEE
jgi:hypothetical protein